ncbi:MAG: carboxypeptidase-like regulatory domain-containing protein [Tepidisphaeraceae bacterium]
MSDSIPPGAPERSGRRVILALASGAVVFLCVVMGVAVWMIRGFLNQPEQTVTIPIEPSQPPAVIARPGQPNNAVALAPAVAANTANGNLFTIGGLVNNEDGNPVGNATVQLNYSSSTPPPNLRGNLPAGANVRYGNSAAVHTDIQGHWSAPNIPKDGLDNLFLQVSSRGYATTPITTPARSKLLDQSAVMVISRGIDLTGTVTDSAGQPVPGADVVIRQRFAARNGNAAPDATTDSDGKFVIHRVAPGQTLPLVVTKAGLAPAFQSVAVVAGGPALTIKLEKARDVTGRVVDRTGNGIDGAQVQLSQWHNQFRPFNLSATTDMDGNFTLHDAPADLFTIQAIKQGYLGQGAQVQAGEAAISLTLAKQITLSGTVTDAATHQPIQQFTVITGAKFANSTTLSFPMGGRAFTGGTYSLPLMGFAGNIDAWYVRIEARGYLPAVSPPLNDSRTQDFALQPGKDVIGRVVDAAGRPVSNAAVAISNAGQAVQIDNGSMNSGGATVTTDGEGRFDLAPRSGKYTLVVTADQGYAIADQDALAQSPDLRLSAWGRVEGKFKGKESSAQQMQLHMNGPGPINVFLQATTDDNGAFAFERLPAGDYVVMHTRQRDNGDGIIRSDTLQMALTTVTPGKTAAVTVGGQGRTITGHVTDSSGAPMSSVEVRVFTQATGYLSTQTDAQGAYEIPDAPLGQVNLIASKSGFLTRISMVSSSESRQDITLAPQPTIRGAVTDAVTHQPISGFTLRIGMIWATGQPPQYQNQNQNPQRGQPVFANGQYQVALDDVRQIRGSGGWIVRVEAKGYLPMVSPVLRESGVQNFELQPGVDLKGTVLDPAGNPAAGVTVALVISGDQLSIDNGNISYSNGEKLQTGADGQFDFPPQTGKFAVVAASDAGFVQADQDALAASTQLHLAPWGRIEGVAKVGSKPAADEHISAQSITPGVIIADAPRIMDGGAADTDGTGHFAIERLAPGNVLLSRMILVKRGGNTFYQSSSRGRMVAVVSAQTVNGDFGGEGRAVSGRVILPSGADWKDFNPQGQATPAPPTPPQMPAEIKAAGMQAQQIWMGAFALTPAGKEFMQKQAQPAMPNQPFFLGFADDGTFRLDDVPPGDYMISVFAIPSGGGRAAQAHGVQFTMPPITPELKDKPLELPDIVTTMN